MPRSTARWTLALGLALPLPRGKRKKNGGRRDQQVMLSCAPRDPGMQRQRIVSLEK